MEELYQYDPRNRLTQLSRGGVVTPFRYDGAGNLLADDKALYSYDAFNRTTKVETIDGNVQINRYDAEGLRHELEENGRLVQFIFNDSREVVAQQAENKWTSYIRTSALLASSTDHARTYYHYASDEMGSTTHIVDGEGGVQNTYAYDAWGNVTEQTENVPNRFKFNGQQLDPISQQYYLRARFYNPVIARFTQEDTYRGDGLNLYAYCGNNPVVYEDSTGFARNCVKDAYDRLRREDPNLSASEAYKRALSEAGKDRIPLPITNWQGGEVKTPPGHIMSPRDPSFSESPIYREGPFNNEQRDGFLSGTSGGTKLAPHHRHQIPIRDGGVIDELPGSGHPEGNQHTAGTPSRHPSNSIFNSEPYGGNLRSSEIKDYWKDKGNRLIPDGMGGWIDSGYN